MPRLIDADHSQVLLLPPDIAEWIPADHPARFIWDLVEVLEIGNLGIATPEAQTGRPPFAPKLLLRLWLYAWMDRARTVRMLERRCMTDLAYIWLTGDHHPDRNTIWRFFRDNKKALEELFKQVVRLAADAGMVGFALHALDGTKMRAACSMDSALHKNERLNGLSKLDSVVDEAPPWAKVDALPDTVNEFAADPANPGTIYAAAGYFGDEGSLFKSTDEGVTWQSSNAGLPSGGVQSVAVNGGVVYAVVDMILYASTNGAASWSKVSDETLFGVAVHVIAAPFDANVLYSLTMDGLSRSLDRGKSWAVIATGLPSGGGAPEVQVVVAAPDVAGTLYAGIGLSGTTGHGVYKSVDRGNAWTTANAGMPTAAIHAIEAGPAGVLRALVDEGALFESTDAGVSWVSLPLQHPCMDANGGARATTLVARDGQLFVLLTSGHLLGTSNGGADWTVAASPMDEMGFSAEPRVLSDTGASSGALLAVARGGGVYRLEP